MLLIGVVSGYVYGSQDNLIKPERPRYVTYSSSYSEGADPVLVSPLKDNELDKQFVRLLIPKEERKEYFYWWVIIGQMKPTGGWRFIESVHEDQISFCLQPPSPNTIVTMAFQAPMVLVGNHRNSAPNFIGECL